MSAEFKNKFLKRIPFLNERIKVRLKEQEENEYWTNKQQIWQEFYLSENKTRTDIILSLVSELIKEKGPNAYDADAKITIAEYAHILMFCQLAVAIPKEGATLEELTELGFSFPPQSFKSDPKNSYWYTNYPDGWYPKPKKTNWMDSENFSYEIGICDKNGDERLTVFWLHSPEAVMPISNLEILKLEKSEE